MTRGIFYLRHCLFWFGLIVAAYWLWLDRQVATTFESRQWDLPARVFARPVELYPGLSISREQLISAFEQMDYRRVGVVQGEGQYAASERRIEAHIRGFEFWDEPQPAQRVSIDLAGDMLHALNDLDTADAIDLLRLEPVEIGRINPIQFEDRKLLQFKELPTEFVAALIAVEDRRFHQHFGIDLIGLARAMVANLRAGGLVQGGSTLTQQLVKNFYLTRERTIRRKLVEMMMAISLELRYDKDEILQAYVNEVFLGQDGNRAIHGFGLAAEFYFGKPLGELDEGEWAVLIGMVKGPSYYDPRKSGDAAKKRRNVVLSLLQKQGLLTDRRAEELADGPLRVRRTAYQSGNPHPAFLRLVKRQLARDYSADDLQTAGLKIFTTLQLELQQKVEQATSVTVESIERDRGISKLQAAGLIVEPRSGDVLALVSDKDPSYDGFNRALDARRPIGSVVKPFVYSLALAEPERYNLASPLNDAAVEWRDPRGNTWTPRNFDGREHGRLSLIEALTRSLNLATVNLAFDLGVERVRDHLVALGLGDSINPYPSIVLGAVDLSPYELAESYTIFANQGFRVPLRSIVAVTDRNNSKLRRYGLKLSQVLQPDTVALINHALVRVVQRGTGRGLARDFGSDFALAGKTGTTDDNRDSWFAGFGDNRLAVTWIGRDDNSDTGLTGSSGALRLWSAWMKNADLRPYKARYGEKSTLSPVDLRTAVIVPAHCVNAESIPVHASTRLMRSDQCSNSAATQHLEQTERDGFLQRLQRWFD